MQLDPGSKLLRDVAFLRTYAETLPSGKKETVEQTFDRVQRMHTKRFPHLAAEIDAVFGPVRDFKAVPSMRSMQFAGYAIERSEARIYNCFAKETSFLTDKGLRSFAQCIDGERVLVRGHRGWHTAIVRKFGQEQLFKLRMRRGKREEDFYTTANHRWITTDGSQQKLQTTLNLKKGDRFLTSHRGNRGTGLEICPIAIQHGIVFGDGTYDKKQNECRIQLCGDSVELSSYFYTERKDRATITGLPATWKELPSLEMNKQYLLGFLAGWFAADGTISSAGSNIALASASYSNLEWARSALALLNIFTAEIRSVRDINPFNGEPSEMWCLPINSEELFKEFFLKTLHHERYKEEYQPLYWHVDSIEATDRVEDVWCVQEPVHEEFCLSNGVITKNCAYTPIESFKDIADAAWISMNGAGVGYSVQQRHIGQLPVVRVIYDQPVFVVPDDKEGWADSILLLLQNAAQQFNYSPIRAKGAPLTTGGTASGPESLMLMHELIRSILLNALGRQLRPIEVHDIMCHMGDLVRCGGVRRTALLCLFDCFDEEMLLAKAGAWYEKNPQRGRANNSAVILRSDPDVADKICYVLRRCFESNAGEPGIFLTDNLDWGANPCVEIGLKPRQFCNLTEVNVAACETELDFMHAVESATAIGTLQASYTDFGYIDKRWSQNCKDDALLGVSLTGQAEAQHLLTDEILERMADLAKRVNAEWAVALGINPAARIGCTKPSGSTAAFLCTTSGVHAAHDDWFLRRVRVEKSHPLAKYLIDRFGLYPAKSYEPVEQDEYSPEQIVVTIPIKKVGAIKRYEETPIQLLERVKRLHQRWIVPSHRRGDNTHNISVTVSYCKEDTSAIVDWMIENRNVYSGISLLPFDGGSYSQMPFESCTEGEYEAWMRKFPEDLNLYDIDFSGTRDSRKEEVACAGGACELY